MDSLPLVTIVTPAYNQGEYLAETIESVLAQDYPHVEYIVINDGSTDDTASVISRYEERIQAVSRENRGQAATLNEGWSMASGKLVGYLSSDDLLDPGAISRLVSELTAAAGAVVVYCDFRLVDAKGRFLRDVCTEYFDRRRLTECLVCQPGPGALFHRHILKDVGGWNPHLRQVPDFEFWTRVSRCGSFVRVPTPLASCRVHEESASFRKLDASRSDEIISVVESTQYSVEPSGRARARSCAYLVSGKRHFNAGRYWTGQKRWLRAFLLQPRLLLRMSTWRMLASALLRQQVFSIRAAWVDRRPRCS